MSKLDPQELLPFFSASDSLHHEIKNLIDSIPAALFVKDRDSKILLMNQVCEEQWGIPFAEIHGTDGSQFFPPEQMNTFLAVDQEIFASGQQIDLDEPFWNSKLKENRIGHTVKKPIYDAAGKPIYLVCLTFDITDQKSIAAELRASDQKLRGLFELAPMGIALTDMQGQYIEFNEAFQTICGYTRDELNKLNYWALTPQEYAASEAEQLDSLNTKGSYGPYEKEYIRKNGDRIPLRLNGVLIRGNDNQPYIWSIVENISEQKLAASRIHRLTNLYKAISEVNQAIVHMERQEELFPLVCRCAVDFGGMAMAWVGQPGKMSDLFYPLASYGNHIEYLDEIAISSDPDKAEGRGPIGRTWREGIPIVNNDYSIDSMTSPWKKKALAIGWGSSAAFPITRGNRPFAVLSVYHTQVGAFDDEVMGLLTELSTDISFALDNFDRELQRKSAEDSMRLAASVYEASSEAIMITDATNRIIAINPAFTEITGYSAQDALGKNPNILKSGKHDQTFYQGMWHDINTTGRWQGEIWDRRKNGEIYPKWLTINTVFATQESIQHRIALFTDITQKKQSEDLIWQQANFDPLTGLPNRNMFYDRLDQEIKKSHRSGLAMALLFLDLDRFKEVNDTLGHAKGDLLLIEAAQRILSCVRESDTVARLAGDEFTVILSELDNSESVDRTTQTILQRLSEPFQLDNESAYMSASIGVTFYPQDAADIDSMVKNADQAMYAAKAAGRNCYNYFTQSMQDSAQTRMRLANDLRAALSGNQLWVAYQPIVAFKTGKIHKAEALLRWQHPQLGLVSPAEFIPIAEYTGLILDIGNWVFQQALVQVKHWQEVYQPDFQISVNKSPVQIQDKGSKYQPWHSQIADLGLSGESIVVEITEGLLLEANSFINDKLIEFRDAMMQVALDDFGTGYSSLSYLKKFDIDYIKIDQSFVRNLDQDSSDLALCEAIIVMAHKLGMKVIAEGIETKTQMELLKTAGCDYGQGYLWSRPVPANEFNQLLARV